jgi:hypothetical protein
MSVRQSIHVWIWLLVLILGCSPGRRAPSEMQGAHGTVWTAKPGYALANKTHIYVGPLGYLPGLWYQDVSPFYLERVRVGHYRWFPSVVIPGAGIDTLMLKDYIGQTVFIRGRYATVDIHADPPWAMNTIGGVLADAIIPVVDLASDVVMFPALPCSLGGEEIDLRFGITNPLPYDLESARVILDIDGPYQFESGEEIKTHSQCMQWGETFKASEAREFEFRLVRADWFPRRDDKELLMSVLFIGYASRADGIKPVYGLWKASRPVRPASR